MGKLSNEIRELNNFNPQIVKNIYISFEESSLFISHFNETKNTRVGNRLFA